MDPYRSLLHQREGFNVHLKLATTKMAFRSYKLIIVFNHTSFYVPFNLNDFHQCLHMIDSALPKKYFNILLVWSKHREINEQLVPCTAGLENQ